jgi:hypothetical protein
VDRNIEISITSTCCLPSFLRWNSWNYCHSWWISCENAIKLPQIAVLLQPSNQ